MLDLCTSAFVSIRTGGDIVGGFVALAVDRAGIPGEWFMIREELVVE